ncbi:hypothetical protein [Gordonia hankookensis]|uniref:Uncharacterized protein n=1 Tax=Gordonia hankookensis TaxID=589403 RepID=A0ABR7WB82_9ACTN|nr:hypothetical protein [Gordonia hankookensis]MBD1319047.1 hypothetical protein [Gordonia hankookensis]
MTATALIDTTTVRDLLFAGRSIESTGAVDTMLQEHGVVKARLTDRPNVGRAAHDAVAASANQFLSTDLIDLAVAGWKRHRALIDAARRTAASPNSEEIVELVTHTIDSVQRPKIELVVNGVPVGTIALDLRVSFALTGVIAVVRRGCLTHVRSGSGVISGRLTIEGFDAVRREREYVIPGVVQLPVPVRLAAPSPQTRR